MALSYSNLFACLGELVERCNEYVGWYTTLDSAQSETITDYQSAGRYDLLAAFPSIFKGQKQTVLGFVQTVNAQANVLLTDRDLVQVNLPLGGNASIDAVLKSLFAQMVTDSESITACTVTVGSVTMDTANANAGTVLTTKVLDGVNAPGTGFMAIPGYDGLDSELSYDDSVTLKCVTDSEMSGVTEGSESFQWIGLPKPSMGQWGWESTGSGASKSVAVLNSYAYFSNADFEDFTTNSPDDWTITAGTAGTHIFEDASTPHRGDAALKFTGDGSTATIAIKQVPSSSLPLIPNQRYCLACYVKGTAATLAGTLTIKFIGTGYTASSSEKIELDHTALSAQTSYGIESFFINMPDEIPDDLYLSISWGSTPTNAKSVYIDGLAFGPVVYENGVGVAIVAGADKFLVGDTGTFTIGNDDAGVFQTWFRKTYGVQMPSSGSPTRADSLAT